MKREGRALNCRDAMLLVAALSSLCSVVASASDGSGTRRILHQPLYPIEWTPPPPQDISDAPPAGSSPFFPGVPSPPTGGTQTPASAAPSMSSVSKKIVVVAASLSVVAGLAILLLTVLFLYWLRRSGRSPDTGKLIGRVDSDGRRDVRPSSSAAPDLLCLGTTETASSATSGHRRSDELNGSPYRKLGSERVLEMHHPSPDLQPLPPLNTMASRKAMVVPPPMVSSDDDTFYTPHRSVASATSEGPSSPVSQRSLPSMSSGGKEFLAAAAEDAAPRFRKSSPKTPALLNSEVKQVVLQANRQPPPPPPPPPPPNPHLQK